ncbi:hypothetical protein [Thiorhodococcus minor]|uniref:Uncharacterized protein n=1 Tax=Thiorhodococcus minor TaxID=57489 RepID=A0A6M0JW70_9GAMM|nr:hypothetical protein [Thiorhodococcus minor]NEV60415.1 hypothetical protein [Thiorhodococcus minor]
MITTRFDPKVHGFHFSNSDIRWRIPLPFLGFITGKALCGGMVYAALDYFHATAAVPEATQPPAEGSVLHAYIFSRQNDAHLNTVPKFGSQWMPLVGPFVAVNSSTEYQKLKPYLQRGLPVPICLVGKDKGHHLLAIGCEPYRISIQAYDPNHPDKIVTIEQSGGELQNSVDKGRWPAFFVDDLYHFRHPPHLSGIDMLGNWRCCIYCRTLFWSQGPRNGVCPAGATHLWTYGTEYLLDIGVASGDRDWRWCRKCQGLFLALLPGTCPSGGAHDGGTSQRFTLTHYAPGVGGQRNWRRCMKCEGLVFTGAGGPAACSAGGKHDCHHSDYALLMA